MIIPEENAKDLADIPDEVKNALDIIPVARMDEVLANALLRLPEPIAWETEGGGPVPDGGGDKRPTAH